MTFHMDLDKNWEILDVKLKENLCETPRKSNFLKKG